MIKILIIDDEPKVRKALKTLLNSLNVEIEILGEAENAIQGMKLLEQSKPDLLLLDVVMPGMDGFEMLLHLQEQDFYIAIISGYDNFNYAKKAISHNVVDYILKPFDKSDIKKVIDKVTELIHYRDSVSQIEREIVHKEKETAFRRQEKIKQKIYQGKSLNMQEQLDLSHYLTYEEWSLYIFTFRNYYSELIYKYQSDEGLVSYIVVKYFEELLDFNDIPNIVGSSFKKSHLVYWVLVPPYRLDDFQLDDILSALNTNLKMDGIAIKNNINVRRDELSEWIHRIENNIVHYNISLLSKQRILTMKDMVVIPLADKMLMEIIKFTNEIHFFASHGLYKQVWSMVEEHLDDWRNHQSLTIHIIYTFKSSILSVLNHTSLDNDDLDPFLFGMKIQLNLEVAKAYILSFVKDTLTNRELNENQLHQDRSEIIKKYIDLHYSESLSLAGLAKKFFVSKEYLATRYKNRFNMTVHQYIQQVRLYKAKELLEEDYKISNIALMVGYDNFSYFNKLFRRKFGLTPTEYREADKH